MNRHTQLKTYSPLKRTRLERKSTWKSHGYSWGDGSRLKRSRLRVRKFNKKPTEEGASLRELKDEMDGLVRTIIALRDRKCVTCFEREGLQVGHYISRGVLALRFDLENCNGQCPGDNAAHEYNTDAYRAALATRYGSDTVRRLERIGQQNPRLSYVELVAIRDGLRGELARKAA